MNDNGKQPQSALVTDESRLQAQRHSGVSARIAHKMRFRSSVVSAVSGLQDRAMWTNNSFSERTSTHPLGRYGLPAAAIAAILVACHALSGFVGISTLYILLFPGIVYSALSCGIGPSILAVVAALLGAKYWFISPSHSFRVLETQQLISMLA